MNARTKARTITAGEARRVGEEIGIGWASAPCRRRKAELERELHEASHREIVDTQAAATDAAEYVEQLEAAYQHAFAAIKTLVTAIERVQELRGQEGTWKKGNKLGLAPKRPEPWHGARG